MVFPRWRQSIARSLHAQRSKPESKFFQVASISEDNESGELSVENRTVVFRGFVDDSNSFLAITDSRADKCEQWQQRPQAQICWYFTKTREQYRITSAVIMIGHQCITAEKTESSNTASVRSSVWSSLSEKAKAQFFWPSPKQEINITPQDIGTDEKGIPDTFVVLVFNPTLVDYLNLRTEPQTRELHSIQYLNDETSKWSYTSVNP